MGKRAKWQEGKEEIAILPSCHLAVSEGIPMGFFGIPIGTCHLASSPLPFPFTISFLFTKVKLKKSLVTFFPFLHKCLVNYFLS